jgi:hypothetical protein
MYVDGELTNEQSDAVEAFAALHPDLQEELDILLTTKLDAETISFDKTSLLSDSMKQNVIDESLLLYIDDELKGDEKKNLEEKIANDTTYQYQHNLLLQTKLPTEVIAYPNKAELYRKEERRIRPVIWYRAAAAVFVLMASGYMWYLGQDAVPHTNSVATVPASKQTPVQQPNSTPSITEATTNNLAAVDEPTEQPVATPSTVDRSEDFIAANHTATRPVSQQEGNLATQADEPIRTSVIVTPNTTIDAVAPQAIATIDRPQQIINTQPVTTTQALAYNKQNPEIATDNSGYDQAVALEPENNKRGSVKGFLRKATRFIERRTGVATTNEDDELLIGAVAIKLK